MARVPPPGHGIAFSTADTIFPSCPCLPNRVPPLSLRSTPFRTAPHTGQSRCRTRHLRGLPLAEHPVSSSAVLLLLLLQSSGFSLRLNPHLLGYLLPSLQPPLFRRGPRALPLFLFPLLLGRKRAGATVATVALAAGLFLPAATAAATIHPVRWVSPVLAVPNERSLRSSGSGCSDHIRRFSSCGCERGGSRRSSGSLRRFSQRRRRRRRRLRGRRGLRRGDQARGFSHQPIPERQNGSRFDHLALAAAGGRGMDAFASHRRRRC